MYYVRIKLGKLIIKNFGLENDTDLDDDEIDDIWNNLSQEEKEMLTPGLPIRLEELDAKDILEDLAKQMVDDTALDKLISEGHLTATEGMSIITVLDCIRYEL